MYEEIPAESRHPDVVVPFDSPPNAAKHHLSSSDAESPVGVIAAGLEEQVSNIEQRLETVSDGPADDLREDLRSWAAAAGDSVYAALSAAHHAIVYAWATGCVFNLAKDILGHGAFGPWRDRMAAETGISVRTVQLWMKLARDCRDVRALLVPGASLTSAYRATGVLPAPKPDEQEGGDEGDDPSAPLPPATPTLIDKTFTALAEARQRLRHLVELGDFLEEEDRDRLEEEKGAFITLVEKLLNQVVP
jgi:hypothetical protein